MSVWQDSNELQGPLKSGEVFDERYLVTEEIGRGAYAIVYRAKQLDLERDVALKVLSREKFHDSVAVERFMREFRILSDFRHKGIMLVYHVSRSQDGVPYAACEYVNGRSLRELISKDSISWRRALSIISDIAEACIYAHQRGIVHRDLKPENVLLTQDGNGESIKLLDFGLSRVIDEDKQEFQRLTATGQVIGTLSYLSPESFHGRVDERADVYSLACILYELLAGQSLFSVESFSANIVTNLRDDPAQRFPAIKERVPERLLLLLVEMLAKIPEERIPNMDRVLQEAKSIQVSPGKLVAATQWRARLTGQKSIPGIIGIALVAVLLLVLIVNTIIPKRVLYTISLTKEQKQAQRSLDTRTRFSEIQRSYRTELSRINGRVEWFDRAKLERYIAELNELIAITNPKEHGLQYSLWQLKGWLEYDVLHSAEAQASFAKAAEHAIAVSPDSVEAAQSYFLIALSLAADSKPADFDRVLALMKKSIAIFEKYDDSDSYVSIEGGNRISWEDNYRRRIPLNRTPLTVYFGADSLDPYMKYADLLAYKGDCDKASKYYLKASKNQKKIGYYEGVDSEIKAILMMHKCGRNEDVRARLEKVEKFLLKKSNDNLTDTMGMFSSLHQACRETGNFDLEKRVNNEVRQIIRDSPDPDELNELLNEADSQHGYVWKGN